MVTVGIDPHKHVHVAVAVDADGGRIRRPLTAKNDAALIGVLLKWIRSIADGKPVTWQSRTAVASPATWPTACCWPATKWFGFPPG